MRWLLLSLTVGCNICSNVLLKAASLRGGAPGFAELLPWRNPQLFFGFLFAGATLLLYMLTLRKFELSVAYPVVTSLALLGIFLSSWMFFGEDMRMVKLLGAALIVVGVVLLFASPDKAA